MDEIEELITTTLEVLALLFFAASAGWLVWDFSHGAAFAAVGSVLLAGALVMAWWAKRAGGES